MSLVFSTRYLNIFTLRWKLLHPFQRLSVYPEVIPNLVFREVSLPVVLRLRECIALLRNNEGLAVRYFRTISAYRLSTSDYRLIIEGLRHPLSV
ncbi:MAG: hypothetical protein ACJAZ9_000291 [Neolewinella sp.]|jgi:hypothetical protein